MAANFTLEERAEAMLPEASADGGAAILDDVHAFIGRFVAYPSPHAREAHALWIAHTHLMDLWDSTPRIAFLSPEPGSGKSRALEVTEPLVPRAIEAVNVTPAYLFRKVGKSDVRPTILHDEIDTVFGPRAKDNEEVRGLLNAGHRRHGVAGRCQMRGREVFTEEIPAYCAVALAGLGGLPDTILSRCVIVNMRRRLPSERVEPYRRRINGPEGQRIGARLAAWAEAIEADITGVFPVMPEGIADRDADVWEALIAVADAAGGDWPARSRAAAVAMVAAAKESSPSLGLLLLADLRSVFGDLDAMATECVLRALHSLDEAPWGDLRGKPLDARGLSGRLRPYGVKPGNVRVDGSILKGYRRCDLHDAFSRYLIPLGQKSATAATPATNEHWRGTGVADGPVNVAAVADVTVPDLPLRPNGGAVVADVADVADFGRNTAEAYRRVRDSEL